ncbi:superoxide dismutase [Odoribacter lunatus]|uniref:superoxide dismutase n=1 Tax=Odoribacter lunatus TaxID=2941335 RepID=UPI00203AF125|nr:superoxide dismutase [Odoribacter lunatus]
MNTTFKNQIPCVLLSSNTINARGDDKLFRLQPLPYTQDALAPYISEQTVQFHYGKHLATYIENTNKQKAGTEFENQTIEEIMLKAEGGLFNNASQVYNHYFQFEAFQPSRQNEDKPGKETLLVLEKEFGSFEEFKAKFSQAAITLFGSGYAWLTLNAENHKPEIIQTHNAENPLKAGKVPLLNIDVWEHAYYLDVQNLRAKYVENFWKIVNWKVVEERLKAAKK